MISAETSDLIFSVEKIGTKRGRNHQGRLFLNRPRVGGHLGVVGIESSPEPRQNAAGILGLQICKLAGEVGRFRIQDYAGGCMLIVGFWPESNNE